MNIKHHIGADLIVAYAAGDLAEGWSLAVATHLALCPDCRRRAGEAEAVGGALIEVAKVAPVAEGAFERALERAMKEEAEVAVSPRHSLRPVSNSTPIIPEPLRSYVGGDIDDIVWRKLGRRARQFLVKTEDRATSVRLLRIPAGEPVPEHGHRGMELTLVLSGSLVDGEERFDRGDVEHADESIEHQPRAGVDEDCICLAVTDAPLRFKSIIVRLAQPFLKI